MVMQHNLSGRFIITEAKTLIENISRVSILVVENEPNIASYIEDVLDKAGFQIAGIAASAHAAISIATTEHPRLALVDIGLAGDIDGIELAHLLRDQHSIPTIFISGAADENTLLRAKSVQPLGFLSKPFLPSHVFNAIQQALGKLAPSKSCHHDEILVHGNSSR